MKRLLILISLLTALAAPVYSQEYDYWETGRSYGIDKDSLLFLIGSPFDNWYVTFGAGLQTFIGNEVEVEASHNKLNYNMFVQVGKWVIPDLAVSLRYSYFTVDGQSRYGLQPFINFEEVPLSERYDPQNPTYYNYQPFHAQAMSLVGYVILDWTNFFLGYEVGKRTRTHVYMPIGMGASMLYGPVRNPRRRDMVLGSISHNFELCYDFAIGIEHHLSPELAFTYRASLFGSESTWDWSPYDNTRTRFDIMPQFTVGARLNLLSHVNKQDPYTKQVKRAEVIHYFRTVGSSHEIERRERELVRLARERDSLGDLIDKQPLLRGDILKKYDSLQLRLDSLNYAMPRGINVMEELSAAIERHNIPAAIVYYELDKYKIDYNGRRRLQNFVKSINMLDDTLEFYVIGAADSITGTIRHNQWLSERRSEAALNMMVDNFGADPNQFILVPAGGIMDYDPPEYNRMAMIILRTPVTEAIVRRWIHRRNRR